MEERVPTTSRPLRGFFFPLMSPGHMIPLIDIAVLLSRRGVSAAVVTTPGNEPFARPAIHRANSSIPSSFPIELVLIPFPSDSAARLLPNGRENLCSIPRSSYPHLFEAVAALRPSLHDLLLRHNADFLVSDAMFTWTADLARDLAIPRIVFNGQGAFPLCVHQSLALVLSSHTLSTRVVLDDLPHRVELSESEIPEMFRYWTIVESLKDAEKESFGVVVNTFYALEPDYADLFRRRQDGRRAWFVGPVSLSGSGDTDSARLMGWLDEQPARSVVFVCFGSLYELEPFQLKEMAIGLESTGQRFVWAVRDLEGLEEGGREWLPEGFEERVEGRGWVLKGWVAQVGILGHVAIGAFVTHCGWNSTLEAVEAGVPMVAWPLMYEQFINERLITDVLGIGVRVRKERGVAAVTAEELAVAVDRVIGGGEEAEALRRRAEDMAAFASAAVEVGGSSYEDVGKMVQALETEAKRGRPPRGGSNADDESNSGHDGKKLLIKKLSNDRAIGK